MKDICFVTWVYGKKYLGYLPIYLYSIHKNYPDYGVKIFLEKKLPLHIKELLEEFGLLCNTDIIEDFDRNLTNVCKSNIERRCIRWLIGEEYFGNEYKYLYFGDVDMYIVNEQPQLAIQHINHITQSGCCFSNSLRLCIKDYIFEKDRSRISAIHLFRLTGLHFIDVKEYFNKVKRTQNLIKRYLSMPRIKLIDYFLEDDERCLWLVVFFSKMKFPHGSYQLSDSRSFRPLHGVHFAVGREIIAYKKNFELYPVLKEEQYKYYNIFKQQYNNDEDLRMLIRKLPFYIIKIIDKTCSFWGDVMYEDKIKTN